MSMTKQAVKCIELLNFNNFQSKNSMFRIPMLLVLFLSATLHTVAKVSDILPRPKQIEKTGTKLFMLHRDINLQDPTDCLPLKDFLQQNHCNIVENAKPTIQVILTTEIPGTTDYKLTGYDNEAYELSVSSDRIIIRAVTPIGVMRAAETLQQMAEGYASKPKLETVKITDYPSFKLRGYMHDTGRSYISFDELKKEIRLLAHFKVNTFHWHLTENQAWRFEVRAYPQLTADTSMVRDRGQYYTQAQCRELEAYAKQYGVIVIPEIDMPGHSAAFERAMGHSMQTDEGVVELKTILREVVAAFPFAPYIHIGGDEKQITYPQFLQIMTQEVRRLGKKAIVWVPNQAHFADADMAQLWSTAGKLIPGIPNIDCRYNYMNHFDVFADLVGIYKSNIYYQQQGSPDVAGEICALWNDHKLATEADILRQNNFYANVIASASRAWQGGGKQYIEKGGVLLPTSGDEFDDFRDWERRFLFHKAHCLRHEPIAFVAQTHVFWGMKSVGLQQGPHSNVQYVAGAGVYLQHTWKKTVPAIFDDRAEGDTAYVWTSVYSPKNQVAGALVELQNYSRSEQDKAPENGQWDRRGSKIWWNGKLLEPPTWVHPGQVINNETDMGNENFTGRPPLKIFLHKGWNQVLMMLPNKKAEGIRLNKWMFTFVITDVQGKNALTGIHYDPHRPVTFHR